MAATLAPMNTLAEVYRLALSIDTRIHHRKQEKHGKGVAITLSPVSPESRDPNAMDIDATRAASLPSSSSKKTLFSFRRDMRGRCYGCGSKDHTKAQGKHNHEVCNHCGRTGHRAIVCMDKYLGKPGKGSARVGASTQGSRGSRRDPLPRLRLPASYPSPITRAHGALRDYLGHRMAEIDRQVRALQEERWYWSTADFRLRVRPASPSPGEITRVQPDVESMHRWTQQRQREGEWEDTRPWQGGFARAWSDGSSS